MSPYSCGTSSDYTPGITVGRMEHLKKLKSYAYFIGFCIGILVRFTWLINVNKIVKSEAHVHVYGEGVGGGGTIFNSSVAFIHAPDQFLLATKILYFCYKGCLESFMSNS